MMANAYPRSAIFQTFFTTCNRAEATERESD